MATASSTESLPTTSGSRFTGPLAAYADADPETWESWTPAPDEAQGVIASVAAYCRDYCPARLACVEESCRLYRLEERANAQLGHSPSENVGVVGAPIIGL